MKYLLALMFLVGCNKLDSYYDDEIRSKYEPTCQQVIDDAVSAERIRLKGVDNPAFIYGAHIRIVKGFYRTQTGMVSEKYYNEYKIKPDIKIKNIEYLELYPDDLEVIK